MPQYSPFDFIHPKPQSHQWLHFGEIRPVGWLRAQLQRDLETGFVGHLDELVPDLICKDDIYGVDRLTRQVRSKDLGVIASEADWQVQYLWWNSETQSNWWDGLVRSALLLDHPDFLPKVRAYIEQKLATQDADGYLGIYAPDLRYNFSGENGELWAQASLLRVLLGYYEATGEERVLRAVQRAVAMTMRAYPIHGSHPFSVQESYAGVCHGLVFTDVLDRLGQLTGDEIYPRYALWLYQEYSQNILSQTDIQYTNLLDPAYRFQGHGVHTYEHLRSLLTAVYAGGNPRLEEALQGYLQKLGACLTPGGGPIGDENIAGRAADVGETGYEYCSIHELLDSYAHLLQKSGEAVWGDRIEWLLFNAGQGARHPHQPAIAYLKTDNSDSMTGPLHPADSQPPHNPQTRYKYSPVHQDVAVCCVPNAGRIYPYFVKSMWLSTNTGLAAALYGPCQVETQVNGAQVRICEETRYPFRPEISFILQLGQAVEFELALRKPGWATGQNVDCPENTTICEADGWIRLRRIWRDGDRVRLIFKSEVCIHSCNPLTTEARRTRRGSWHAAEMPGGVPPTFQKILLANSFVPRHAQRCRGTRNSPTVSSEEQGFVSCGPLLFALPIPAQECSQKEYSLAGFCDIYSLPEPGWRSPDLVLRNDPAAYALAVEPFSETSPWQSLAIDAPVYDSAQSRVRLAPMGGCSLRRVIFPFFEE